MKLLIIAAAAVLLLLLVSRARAKPAGASANRMPPVDVSRGVALGAGTVAGVARGLADQLFGTGTFQPPSARRQ